MHKTKGVWYPREIYKILLVLFFLLSLSLTVGSVYRIITSLAPDFSVLWLAASDLPAGKNPYLNPQIFTGVGYPPNTLLFYIPLTLLPYQLAQTLFIFLSLFSIIGSLVLSFKIVFNRIPLHYFLLGFALTLLSFPTKFTLGMGQNNSLALLLLLVSFFFYKEKKFGWAGTFLGLAVVLKTIFIFFILFFVLKKAWKMLFYSVLSTSLVILLTIIVSGIHLYQFYFEQVIPPLLNLVEREIYYNQGLLGFISRLTENIEVRKFLGIISTILLVGITAFFTTKSKRENLLLSLFIITLLLTDTLSWQHHFVWLIFPIVVVVYYAIKLKKYWAWFLIGLAYVLVSWNFKTPEPFYVFPKSLILSNTFYGAIILYLLNIYLLHRKRFIS